MKLTALLALLALWPLNGESANVGPVYYNARLTNVFCAAWDSTTTVTAQSVDIINPYAGAIIRKMSYHTGGTTPSFLATLKINGTNVTSCSITVNSATPTSTTCTGANTLGVNDKITIAITSPTGTPNQATVCAVLDHPVE